MKTLRHKLNMQSTKKLKTSNNCLKYWLDEIRKLKVANGASANED